MSKSVMSDWLNRSKGLWKLSTTYCLGAAISDVLQEVHIRLVGAAELLIQGVDLADFAQAAVLQD